MPNSIGVKLKNDSAIYYFNVKDIVPKIGSFVILETARGLEMAEITSVSEENAMADENTAGWSIKRLACDEDMQQYQKNLENETNAYKICKERIAFHKLEMKLVNVEYTFDSSKLIAYFTANGRVDFRVLVKDLASIFKTRIELKQIGVRDEAKMINGLGPCGRPLCCSSFLKDFEPVSIKMAKEQGLSLNPAKISGICGRLMCCLKYEQSFYEESHKSMPKVGKTVNTPDGKATVIEVNVLKESVVVQLDNEQNNGAIKVFPANLFAKPSCGCACNGQCSCKRKPNGTEKPEN